MALRLAIAAALLVVAAAGLSSLESDDYCVTAGPLEEGGSVTSAITLSPPGFRCVYELASGGRVAVEAGSWSAFALVLAGGLVLLGVRSRTTWAASVLFAVTGIAGLAGGWQFAMFAGLMAGVPLAAAATLEFVPTAIATAALLAGATLSLLGLDALGWALTLALTGLAGWAVDRRSLARRRALGRLATG